VAPAEISSAARSVSIGPVEEGSDSQGRKSSELQGEVQEDKKRKEEEK
jgi:hypothetical protein